MFGHPKTLFMLSATEMWERFSYYGMRAILMLYMTAKLQEGGLGWSSDQAFTVFGIYTGCVWLTPLLGGFLADNFLGQRRSILIGSFIIAAGHFLLTMPATSFFYGGLACICLGTGFFKPCVTSILGGLYAEKNARRDSAYSIFYMGINVGSILGTLATGWLQVTYNFHYGFGVAGFGMVVAIVMFITTKKYLGDIGGVPEKKQTLESMLPKAPLSPVEKNRVALIGILAVLTILYFAAYEQAGGLLTLYARDYIDRSVGGWEMPASWFIVFNPLFIVLFAPVLSALWERLAKNRKDPSIVAKLGIGFVLTGIAFLVLIPPTFAIEAAPGCKVSMGWLATFYALYTVAELLVTPLVWSTVSRIAPKRYLSLLMAVVLGSIGVGNYLASFLGSYVSRLGPGSIFVSIMVTMFVFGLFCFIANKKLMLLAADGQEEEMGAALKA